MVRKIGERWYYDFMIKRVRYRGVIPEARTKKQALKAESKIRVSVFEGKYGGVAESTFFEDYVKEVYLPWSKANKRAWADDTYHTRVLCQFFKGKTLAQLSPLMIERFKKERRDSLTRNGTRRRPASVNRELACLSRIFSLARDNAIVQSNPCSKVKKLREDNWRVRYLTPEEENRLMNLFTGRRAYLKPLVLVAINTGMRRGELFGLQWQHVDFSRAVIHIRDTKTAKDRDVPMNSQVRDTLLDLRAECEGEEFVFANPRTGLRLTDVKKGFKAACREAGIYDFTFHDLRHTAGTRLADVGTDAFAIAEILGHATLQMTKRYTHATDERKRNALESIAGYNCQKIVKMPEGRHRKTVVSVGKERAASGT